jgi:hypothetical protein
MQLTKLILTSLIFSSPAWRCCGQSSVPARDLDFFGKHVQAPLKCESSSNFIKCGEYVLSWTPAPVVDLPRLKQEQLSQMQNPAKINTLVLGADQTGYVAKAGNSYQLLIIGKVNGQGAVIELLLDTEIKSTSDLPEYVRQFIRIK